MGQSSPPKSSRREVVTAMAAVGFAGCLGGNGGGSKPNTTASGVSTTKASHEGNETTTAVSERDTTTRTATESGMYPNTETTRRATSETEASDGADVTNRQFVVRRTDAQPTDEARITTKNGGTHVVVTGMITGENGCRTAVLDGVERTDAGLVVTVATERDAATDSVCSMALVGITYRLALVFDTPPGPIRVVYRDADGSHEVAHSPTTTT